MFKTLSNESLVKYYLKANELILDQSFIDLLLDEIVERGIYDSFFETSANFKKQVEETFRDFDYSEKRDRQMTISSSINASIN